MYEILSINRLSTELIKRLLDKNSILTITNDFIRFMLVSCTMVGTATGDKGTEDMSSSDHGKLQLLSLLRDKSFIHFYSFFTLKNLTENFWLINFVIVMDDR